MPMMRLPIVFILLSSNQSYLNKNAFTHLYPGVEAFYHLHPYLRA